MKNFLTKKEACTLLDRLKTSTEITHEDSVALVSIKICLAAEEMGLSFWGEPVEAARPAFRDCEIPDENSTEEVFENYKSYKECLEEVKMKFARIGG